jgi:SAM-dependent methyltransferase
MTSETSAQAMPLRIGSRQDFARVAQSLRDAGFDETTLCRVLKINNMAELGAAKTEELDYGELPPSLALFIRAFLSMELIPRAEVEKVLDRETLSSFLALDLLRLVDAGALEMYHTPVLFYPLKDFLVASDRRDNDTLGFVSLSDLVFPAIFSGTLRFLRLIPKSPAGDALDLGAGTGIGALMLSRHVRRAVASDITARATHFARFNCMLNGCDNVDVTQGDLYDPVEGQTFDRIVTHPPYMPAARETAVWRDGGTTGESLLQRIIEKLPRYLRPGGTFFTMTLGLDTEDGKFEERARHWLGESRDEFDVIFAVGQETSPHTVIRGIAERDRSIEAADITRLEQAFEKIGTRQMVYGALVFKRHVDESGSGWTKRLKLSTATEGGDLEWAFWWYDWRARPDFLSEFARAKVNPSMHLRVGVTYRILEGALVAVDFFLDSEKPFLAETKVNREIIDLILEFGGGRTPAEIYESARAAEQPDVPPLDDFLTFVATLVERGYLELADGQ